MKKILFLILLMCFTLGQSQTPAAGPSMPPARNAWDVLSQYGSAYTNQSGVIFDSFGGSNIVGDETLLDGSVVKKYLSHSYSGIKVNGAGSLNVSSMTKLHLDVWSPDFASFKIKLEGSDGSYKQLEVPFAKTQGAWNSYDLDLSTYVGVNLSSLKWIVPVTYDPNNTTLFISNVYFYRPATSIPQPTITGFTIPSQLVGAAPFMITDPTSNSAGAFTYTSLNTSVATVSGNTVTVVGAGTATIVANQAADGPYLAGSANALLEVTFAPPATAAPVPTVPQANVISLFSDAYSPSEPAGTNWFPGWGQSTQVSDVLIAGNNTKLYSNFNFEGTEWTPHLDASGMVSLHIDVYTPNSTFLDIYPIVDGQPEVAARVYPTPNSWNSFDILLSSYGIPLADIKQFKMVGSTGSTVYFDNLYFSNVPLTVSPTITAFSIPAKVTTSPSFALAAPTSNSAGAFSYTSSDSSVATVSGNMVTIVGVGTSLITATQAADGSYTSGTITANLVVTEPLPTVPTVAAPTPTKNAIDVISVFSDAYTNVATDFFPNWGQGTLYSQPSIASNPTILYTNLDYQGVEFSAPINAGAMTNLHLDIWTPNVSSFEVSLIANGENAVVLTPTLSGWNSFDIDLSLYSNRGRTLNNVIQFKFAKTGFIYQGENNAVYLDNIYFWKPAGSPTYGAFTVPAKIVGDAAFAITAPTSTSPVAFTYSSSNNSVATISGNMITVVGEGTATITASQVAGSGYLAGSTTTSFVVTYPELTVAAPVPTVPAANVISIFSDTYTNLSGTAFSPYWGQSTQVTDLVIAGNNTKKYTNLNYQGTEFATAINASAMFRLHFDIFTYNCSSFKVYPIVFGQSEQFVELTPVLGQWNSFDIDLSQYTIPLNAVAQFKIVGSNGSTVYLDNIYFSNVCYTQTIFYADADGDGYGNAAISQIACLQPAGYVTNATDCNDANANANPGKVEIAYNGIDDNCDGMMDEGFPALVQGLTGVSCGSTLANNYLAVHATQVVGATAYRFKVTNMASGSVQIIDRMPYFWFQFNTVNDLTYGTTYKIEVMVQMGGTWLGYYGAPCQVTTPTLSGTTATSASLSPASCSATLSSINKSVSANALPGVTGYRFRITNTLDASVQTLDRTVQWFRMNMLPQWVYGVTYTVEVAVKTTGAAYSAYGNICTVTTPAVPGMQNVCDTQITKSYLTFGTSATSGVSNYKFEITNTVTSDVQTIIKPVHYLSFKELSGITPNTFYSFRVSLQTAGSYSAFSFPCLITSPAASREIDGTSTTPDALTENFKVLALPNPFNYDFALDMTSNTTDKVEIKIYDMIGKLIEAREVEFMDINNVSIGENYPTGVYNVIVNQGDNLKTLRIIKR